jgi:hypothetical protein
VRIVQRTGPHPWQEEAHAEPVDIGLSALELTLPQSEVVAGD